ncbi:ribonuclease P [Candidatus Woesearchaeota archaeon]|nr:ribonuclease P [Candidatus Woesearchaeota archaeon]
MSGKYRKNPAKFKDIAKERIGELFEQAKKEFKNDPKLSNRYVELARKIAMKSNVRIPSDLQKLFCKHCYVFLMPSVNCKVRTHEGKVVYTCYSCKKFMRFPYVKEKKKQ